MEKILLDNCIAKDNEYNGVVVNNALGAAMKKDITILGGYYSTHWGIGQTRDETMSVIYLKDWFEDLKIIGATIEGHKDGYGVYAYGQDCSVLIEDCTFRNVYAPIRLGHDLGSAIVRGNRIRTVAPITEASTVCVYADCDHFIFEGNELIVDATQYTSHIVRTENMSIAKIANNIIKNIGTKANNAIQTNTSGIVNISNNTIVNFDNGVYFSFASDLVLLNGNIFKNCNNKTSDNTKPYLQDVNNYMI